MTYYYDQIKYIKDKIIESIQLLELTNNFQKHQAKKNKNCIQNY